MENFNLSSLFECNRSNPYEQKSKIVLAGKIKSSISLSSNSSHRLRKTKVAFCGNEKQVLPFSANAYLGGGESRVYSFFSRLVTKKHISSLSPLSTHLREKVASILLPGASSPKNKIFNFHPSDNDGRATTTTTNCIAPPSLLCSTQ